MIEKEHLTREPGVKQHRGININRRLTILKISSVNLEHLFPGDIRYCAGAHTDPQSQCGMCPWSTENKMH